METKLTAIFCMVLVIFLTATGLVLKYLLGVDFDWTRYFEYLLLLVFLVILLGRPLVKMILDLLRGAYRDHADSFKVPNAHIVQPTHSSAAKKPASHPSTPGKPKAD